MALVCLVFAPHSQAVQGVNLTIQVYADGTALVSQSVAAPPSAATVDVPLLSTVLSNIIATDGNGAPLSFRISGGNVTVYTLGATAVNLRYETQNLTGKAGTVWTLAFTSSFNSTVTLPAGSSVTRVSGVPYSIGLANGFPVVELSPGSWAIDYGVPIGSTGTTTTSTTQGGGSLDTTWGLLLPVAGAVVVVAVFAVLLWRRRRPGLGTTGAQLRPDDIQVLNFIREKGGKVSEPEIRTRFALPKTSTWRQIKRLERLGWVKVVKVGAQNQIELLKKREEESN